MSENVASLLLAAAEARPELRIGDVSGGLRLAEAVAAGERLAAALESADLARGARLAVVGDNSDAYFVFWIGCQLAGAEAALINPSYPLQLLGDMIDRLDPAAVATPTGATDWPVPAPAKMVGFADAPAGYVSIDGAPVRTRGTSAEGGLSRGPLDTAGYMHTSGTSGVPKFCAQSQRYFVRLARYVADTFCLSPDDRVFAPLPAFHINPLGYGFLGALVGLADTRTVRKFSASGFWPAVRAAEATVAILHGPPVEILKRRTGTGDAANHRLRAAFLADEEFLDRFRVPASVSAYGSTEAGGLTHTWLWRRGEVVDLPEGLTRLGGRARADVEWALGPDGEIRVRGREPGVLFGGYFERGELTPGTDPDGWFATGDLGRTDAHGRLVFIERLADSVRVKGEYVPLPYVEATFGGLPEVADVAAWKRPGDLGDDELVLYVACPAGQLPVDAIRAAAASLPKFMTPTAIAQVSDIPRDPGVRKVQRRRLPGADAVEWVTL